MDLELKKIIAEIDDIKRKLDHSHETDQDYLPKILHELRAYIFQVHASYETSLEIMIWKNYLKTSRNFWDFEKLFELLSFNDKQRIVHSEFPSFPSTFCTKINELRNSFAHKRGEILRNEYDDRKRLEVYRLLKESHDALNNFFVDQAGAGKK